MIALIGGPPRCGKSTLARAWAAGSASSFLPADYLTSAISGYLDPDRAARQLPRLPGTFRDNDTKYRDFTVEEIIANYRTKAATTWPAIRDVIEYAIADGNSFVIEGYQIEPAAAHALLKESPAGSIAALFLHRTDVDQVYEALRSHPARNDWATSYTQHVSTLRRIAEMVCDYSAVIAAEASDLGLPTINMNDDFARQVRAGLDVLRGSDATA